ncbi:MAG: DegT/DnrJ/EryC1/StrS family aminotransferase [Desulfovibrionaceae bacterium]|nr:DegT/DnrJ/EryC1/StrS family aminotransferase [Desulfovibrionaceae bacterium]
MRDSFLVFGQPLIGREEISEVVDSLEKAWLGTGPKVHRFEQNFAAYKNLPCAAAVNSCTAALHLSCLALNPEPGDEIITTAMTFCASVNAIIHAGATPVLADIDPVTLNIDPADVERKITPRTRAIMVVHFAGRMCRMDEIMRIAKKYNLSVIEDCAHSIESAFRGVGSGHFGDLACYSFYATKNVVTGEGGMVLGKNRELIDRIKIMALHGMSADAWARFSDAGFKHYQVVDHGFKYNMMDLQAAIGIHQLEKVEENWKKRRRIWQMYVDAFSAPDFPAGLGLPAPLDAEEAEGSRHACHLFTVEVDEKICGIGRDQFLSRLTAHKIGVGVHYLAIPEHPYYQKRFGWRVEDFPHAMAYGRKTISLPLSPRLSDEDVADVIAAVKEILLNP